jgi:hypothetical protein
MSLCIIKRIIGQVAIGYQTASTRKNLAAADVEPTAANLAVMDASASQITMVAGRYTPQGMVAVWR